AEDDLDGLVGAWTATRNKFEAAEALRTAGIPAAAVQRPGERIDQDPDTAAWGLWPTVHHTEMGDVRVDGIPVHLSETDWTINRGAGCLGEHNDQVYGGILGLGAAEIAALRTEGVI
ncbi:MAG: CoA transferase, partial [Dehalococcoidia bacterium]